jgi:hypothetical protein
MEAVQVMTENAGTGGALATKQKHARYKKLKGDELAGLPGVNIPQAKPDTQAERYSIAFKLRVPGEIGNADAITRCYGFANGLDQQAREKNLGQVGMIGIGDGECEVVLMLNVDGPPEKPGAPVINAFNRLSDFLSGAEILKSGPAGKAATWKAKVKNTTIADGHYQTE